MYNCDFSIHIYTLMLKIRHIQEIKVLLVYAIDLVGFGGWRLESLIYLEYICRDVMLMFVKNA